MSKTSIAFKAHIDELQKRAEAGDSFSVKSLAAMALLIEGWRPGDDDPDPGDPDPGDPVVDLSVYRYGLAA